MAESLLESRSHTEHELLQLPSDIKLIYHAEGAANIVFKIAFESSILPSELLRNGSLSPPPTEIESWEVDIPELINNEEAFRGQLLRLRKDKSHVTTPLQSQKDFDRYIAPLFLPEELVQSKAVEVGPRLIDQLNDELRGLEINGKRPPKRHGTYLKNEKHGALVADVAHGLIDTGRVFEIKPKWLLQSLDAPKTSRRCRTCALRALRLASKAKDECGSGLRGFCPLDLVSKDRTRVAKALKHPFENTDLSPRIKEHIITYLVNSSLLQKLRDLQQNLYTIGVLHADPNDMNFLIVMTLRDCSLFLTATESGIVSARLADLDLKSAARFEHWRETEQVLIDGRWYDRVLHGDSEEEGNISCALER